jgi:hypothetical protein
MPGLETEGAWQAWIQPIGLYLQEAGEELFIL